MSICYYCMCGHHLWPVYCYANCETHPQYSTQNYPYVHNVVLVPCSLVWMGPHSTWETTPPHNDPPSYSDFKVPCSSVLYHLDNNFRRCFYVIIIFLCLNLLNYETCNTQRPDLVQFSSMIRAKTPTCACIRLSHQTLSPCPRSRMKGV